MFVEIWLKIAGVLLGSLFSLYIALLVPKPRICLRIAQLVGSVAISVVGTAVMLALGAFLAKRAVLAQSADTYAITDGEAPGDGWVRDNLAAAIDPVIGQFVVYSALALAVLALSAAAIYVSRMILDDDQARSADGSTGDKPHKG